MLFLNVLKLMSIGIPISGAPRGLLTSAGHRITSGLTALMCELQATPLTAHPQPHVSHTPNLAVEHPLFPYQLDSTPANLPNASPVTLMPSHSPPNLFAPTLSET